MANHAKQMLLEERRSKVTLTEKIEADLLTQINTQKKNAAWFSSHYHEALTMMEDIKRFTRQLEAVDNRLGFLELEAKAPGFIRIESLARPPDDGIRGGRKKLLITVLVVSIAFSLIAPIVIDMLDRRISTAGQVEKLIGYKPLAAFLEPDKTGRRITELTNHKRSLALALERDFKQSAQFRQI